MSFPITHLVFSEGIFKNSGLAGNTAERDFFLGVSFPDIRYLGVIERSVTHTKNNGQSAFLQGMNAHLEMDIFRFEFLAKILPEVQDPIKDMTIKLLEDLLFYEKSTNWQKYQTFFDEVIEDELALVDDVAAIQHWHMMMRDYLAKQPDFLTLKDLANRMNINPKLFRRVKTELLVMQDDDRIKDAILQMYQEGSHSGYCISFES